MDLELELGLGAFLGGPEFPGGSKLETLGNTDIIMSYVYIYIYICMITYT